MSDLGAALKKHRGSFALLPGAGGAILHVLIGPEDTGEMDWRRDEEKAKEILGPQRRRRHADPQLQAILGAAWGSGPREPALFEHPAAAACVQAFVDEEVAKLSRFLHSHKGDFYDGAGPIAALAVPLLIEPCFVRPKEVYLWRARLRALYAGMIAEDPDHEDNPFWGRHMANLEAVLARLLAKFWR